MPRARLAKNCHSCGVRPVSVEGGTEIEQHEIARRELAAGRFRMRQGRVRTRLDERPKRKLPAQLADRRSDHQRDVHLRLAHAKPRDDFLPGGVRDRSGADEPFDLFVALRQPQAPDLRPDVDELARTRSRGDHLCRMKGQVVFLHPHLGGFAKRAGDHRVRVLAIAPGNHLSVRRVAPRALALERRHHEDRLFAPDGQRHQALKRFGVEAGQISDRNRARDVNRVELAARHPPAHIGDRRRRCDRLTQCP